MSQQDGIVANRREPLTIDDRVEHSVVELAVRIEKDQVDEFAQEIQQVVSTLHGSVAYIRVVPAHQTKGVR